MCLDLGRPLLLTSDGYTHISIAIYCNVAICCNVKNIYLEYPNNRRLIQSNVGHIGGLLATTGLPGLGTIIDKTAGEQGPEIWLDAYLLAPERA